MKRSKSRVLPAALSIALLGVMGCANVQQAAPVEAQAQVTLMGAAAVSIYRPDTRTLYLWTGDPRPSAKHPMNCMVFQISENPGDAPRSRPCQ